MVNMFFHINGKCQLVFCCLLIWKYRVCRGDPNGKIFLLQMANFFAISAFSRIKKMSSDNENKAKLSFIKWALPMAIALHTSFNSGKVRFIRIQKSYPLTHLSQAIPIHFQHLSSYVEICLIQMNLTFPRDFPHSWIIENSDIRRWSFMFKINLSTQPQVSSTNT